MRCLTDSIFTRALIVGFALLSFALQPARASDFEIAIKQGCLLVVMAADGSNQTVVYSTPWCAHEPSWSPDGKSLVFKDREGIYRIDGVDQGQLTEWPNGTLLVPKEGSCVEGSTTWPFDHVAGPKWSPAGHEIVFDAFGVSEMLCTASSSTPSSAGSPPELLKYGYYDAPAWDSTGERIATLEYFPDNPEPSRLTILDRASGSILKSWPILIDGQPDDTWGWMDWARNGDPRIAFSTTGFKNEWIYTLDTSQPSSDNPDIESLFFGWGPSWSPDNSALAFVNPRGQGTIERYTFATGQSERLAGAAWHPDWRPALAACGEDTDCDDANPCTDDACDSGLCSHNPSFALCDDGNECTFPDACNVDGVCLGTPADEGESCSSGYCCSGQCVAPECETNEHCADNDFCTIDTCDFPSPCAASCQYEPNSDPACQCLPKGEICATNDECCSGQCHPVKSTCK